MNGAVNAADPTAYQLGQHKNNLMYTCPSGTKCRRDAGSELQELSGLYDTYYRQYACPPVMKWRRDASLGRFNAIDPKAVKFASSSPYHYSYNNPVLYNDPLGDEAYDAYGNGWRDYWRDEHRPQYRITAPMSNRFGVTTGDMGSNAPGSGYYWSDGISFDDWNAHTGSAGYREGLESGLQEFGGRFFYLDGQGERVYVKQNNGEILIPYNEWTEVTYSDGTVRNKNYRTGFMTLSQAQDEGLINSITDPGKKSFFEKLVEGLTLWITQFKFDFDPYELVSKNPDKYNQIQKVNKNMDNVQILNGTAYFSINVGKEAGWVSGYGQIVITGNGVFYGGGGDFTAGTSIPGIDGSIGVFYGISRSNNFHNNYGPGATVGYSFIGIESSFSGSLSNPRLESFGVGISTSPVWGGVNYGITISFFD